MRATLDLIGHASRPVGVFSQGFFSTRARFDFREPGGQTLAIVAIKIALLPAACYAALYLAGVDDPAYRSALASFIAMPTVVGALTSHRY
ncbi:MAG: hypothetical protein U5J99_11655 [Parvularculaceae bacterium]|nr:hypothetical protein [Parvularculaceae bacterium]